MSRLLIVAGTVLLIAGCRTAPREVSDARFEERLLARVPDEWADGVSENWNAFMFGPDGGSVAYVVQQDRQNEVCFLVHGDRKGPTVWSIGAEHAVDDQGAPVFSRDGRHLAYAARLGPSDKGPWRVVIDGVPGPVFSDVADPIFSPDGLRVAYEAWDAGKKFVVLDMKPLGREVDEAESPLFSPDSKRFAYAAHRIGPKDDGGNVTWTQGWFVVDGIAGERFDEVREPVFSPDSARFAYVAIVGNEWFVVLDGKRGPSYDWIDDPIFSPDGRRCAYAAGKGEDSFIVVDGKRLDRTFYYVERPRFSPDGRRLAYLAVRSKLRETPFGEKKCVVVDGLAGEDGDSIHDVRFSADSRRFGYTMVQEGKDSVVVDGKKYGADYDSNTDLAFSPDGSRFAFVGFKGGEAYLVCGDRRSEPFDIARDPVFSPDGLRIAFGAKKGREFWWKVMELK